VLRDCFTRLEHTLIELGRPHTVRETRQVFQDLMRDRFSDVVGKIVGRPVIGFLSQVSTEPECVVEIFMFEPQAGASDGQRSMDGRAALDGHRSDRLHLEPPPAPQS
jgi:uncharacterized protein YbcI